MHGKGCMGWAYLWTREHLGSRIDISYIDLLSQPQQESVSIVADIITDLFIHPFTQFLILTPNHQPPNDPFPVSHLQQATSFSIATPDSKQQ